GLAGWGLASADGPDIRFKGRHSALGPGLARVLGAGCIAVLVRFCAAEVELGPGVVERDLAGGVVCKPHIGDALLVLERNTTASNRVKTKYMPTRFAPANGNCSIRQKTERRRAFAV
ncbi:MAG: hypothetical protein OXH98_01235, partial [Caldilineaceae bacterium]|nr:hypothetical protein [Caldilineaceae bacterium]